MNGFSRRHVGKGLGAAAIALAAGGAAGRKAVAAPLDLGFPPDFVWGCASAAYQIEGAVAEDGRGPSIWDTFSHTPGKVANGDTGDVACDSYHRYGEDVQLLKNLGAKAYRMSISWSRIFPDGRGQPNEKGVDYYKRVLDDLHENGIEPYVTLFHWDLPQALQDRGGWGNRAIADWFTEYAQLMTRRLGDRAKTWVMFNEPQVHAIMGHGLGEHAPGLHGPEAMAAAGHHLNLAQGRALAALRREHGSRLKLGTVMSLQPVRPSQNSDADREAARVWDAAWNRAYLDPLFRGVYPEIYLPLVEELVQPDDMEQIRQPVDFLGVNYYAPMYQRSDPKGLLGTNWGALPADMKTTAMTWGIDPGGLTDMLGTLRTEYGNPRVYITENGAFFPEQPAPSGRVHDARRIAYLRDHIAAAHRALADGANLGGYFIWTLVDNWEWSHGFTAKFGLARLDRATLTRRPKASFDWFARIARSNVL